MRLNWSTIFLGKQEYQAIACKYSGNRGSSKMTLAATVLFAGLLVFIPLVLTWLFASLLHKLRSKQPIPPGRSALQLVLFVGTILAWLSLIGLTEGGELDDLVCVWAIMVPAVAFGAFMAYLGNKKRNLLLEKQSSSESGIQEIKELDTRNRN
jgi:hypothetical protein